jgi:hypothetical protein
MKLEREKVHWVAGSELLYQARVTNAVFLCKENKFDVERVEITCEDASALYAFTLARGESGFAGVCATWTKNTHELLCRQAVECALINVIDGGASLLSGKPMNVHGRMDLYWMIRVGEVRREVQNESKSSF